MADGTKVYVPKTFTDGAARVTNGHKTVDETTAARWVEAGKARLMSNAVSSVGNDASAPAPASIDHADAVPFVAGAFGKGEAPSFVKDFKAAARANIRTAEEAGESPGATVTVTQSDESGAASDALGVSVASSAKTTGDKATDKPADNKEAK